MDSKFDLTSFIFFPKTEYIATLEITIASDLIDKKVINPQYPLMTWEDSVINMQILNKWKNILHKV